MGKVARPRYQTPQRPDPGTAQPIPTHGFYCLTIGAGAETNTVATPKRLGDELIITVAAVGAGTRAITFPAAINNVPNTVATFTGATKADQSIMLRACYVAGALRWQLVQNNGTTLS